MNNSHNLCTVHLIKARWATVRLMTFVGGLLSAHRQDQGRHQPLHLNPSPSSAKRAVLIEDGNKARHRKYKEVRRCESMTM